ncbi:hypothetical protein BGZ63DRAFT_393065 [Mariannaea sp. PMI_226]|nr:hypothetical protein BGZ63DRAFT_393065 [Mariannaea sp. PMI_226]
MGGWDIYCAICGGPFTGIYFRSGNLPRDKYLFPLGPDSQEAAPQQEDDEIRGNVGENEEHDGNGHHNADDDHNNEAEKEDADEAWSDTDLECCYDDAAASRVESHWMNRTQVLGYNPDAPGLQKSFLSGVGNGENIEYGHLEVPSGGDDSFPTEDLFEGMASLSGYTAYDKDESPCIPFHPDCYALLERAFRKQTSRENIDQDTLYRTLIALAGNDELSQKLNVNYGEPEPPLEQYWVTERGREVHLANPLKITGLDEKLNKLPRSDTPPASNSQIPSWFWEADSLPDDLNLSALSTAIKRWASFDVMKTSLENIRNGTLLGLANRRRIWGVLEQLAGEYAAAISSSGAQHAPGSATELWIKAHAINRQLPPTMLPNPLKEKDTRQESCFFVKSWNDADRGASVELHWNSDGALVGITSGVSLFGNSQPLDGRTAVVTLPAGDWIQAMTLSFDGTVFNLSSCADEEYTAWIAGITIHTTAGLQHEIGSTVGPKRLLTVSPSNTFVGLIGQTDSKGISRLGLLECPREEDTKSPPVPEAEKLLWKHEVLPSQIRALPFETGYWKFLPLNFVQQEALILGTTQEELSRVSRIGVCAGVSGEVLELGRQSRTSYMPMGLAVEYEGQEIRKIGCYNDEHINWFDIDGAAGERLTRVGIGMNELPKRLEFVTSYGRHSQQFGDPQSNYVDWQQAAEGEILVGIAASFGYPRGHTLGTTSINALVMQMPPGV